MHNNFVEHSLVGAFSFFRESVFSDAYALENGFLQSLDARIKVVSFTALVVAILFIKNSNFLFYLYAACLFLVLASRISLVAFLKRTWIFIPIFSLFIALPALFRSVTPGETLISFWFLGVRCVITKPGMYGAALFVMRVVSSLSYVVLLGLVTRHSDLLGVLRVFKIPQVFVMTLGMCYRYIYLFMKILEDTYFGIKSRVGIRLHYARGQGIVAWNIASLWQRSLQLNEEVYSAMRARGYTGELRTLDTFKTHARDWLWLSGVVCACVWLVVVGSYG